MYHVTEVEQKAMGPSDGSGDSDSLESEYEKPGESTADKVMMQWALRALERTQYLSDLEEEDAEEKERSPVRVRSSKAKRVLKTQEAMGPSEGSGDSDSLESEYEKPGESTADKVMMQWALRALERTQYLSDLEEEDAEEKERSPVRVRSSKAKRVLKTQEAMGPSEGSGDSDSLESEYEKPGESTADKVMMQWALRALERTQYLSDLEEEDEEEKERSPVRVRSPKAKRVLKTQSSTTESVTVAASSPVAPSAVTMKDEPPLSPSAASEDAEDHTEESALKPVDWYGGDAVLPKTECSTTPSPSAEMDAFDEPIEDPLGDSVSVCPVPVTVSPPDDPLAVTTKEEPPLSASAAVQNADEPINVPAFKAMDWCGCDAVLPKTECSATHSPSADIDAFDEPIEDPLGDSVSACPVPVTASPPDDPLAVTTKEEPPLSASAAVQNADEPINVPAFKAMDWCGGDAVLPKTECSTTPSPSAEMDAFDEPVEDPLGDSVSACPVPVAAPPAFTIKDEPPFSPSSSTQSSEDPMEDSSREPLVGCETVLTKTERSATPPPHASIDVVEEPIEDPLEGAASLQIEDVTLPSMAKFFITPLGVIQGDQFPTAGLCESTTVKVESDEDDCTVDNSVPLSSGQFSSATSPLTGDNEDGLQKKDEALRMKELLCSGVANVDDWDKFVASVPPPRSPTAWTVRPSTPEEKTQFCIQECLRFENHQRAFTYRLHGYESVVGPVKLSYVASGRPNGCAIRVVDERYLIFLALVRDAVGRLPNGVGTLHDITELVSESQYVHMSLSKGASLISKVAGSLALLSWENKPCLRYNAIRNMCIYLHRAKTEEELERMYQQQPNTSEACKSSDMKEVEGDHRTESLVPRVGPPACLAQANTQPTLSSGRGMHCSNSGPQLIYIDTNGVKKRLIGRKLQVTPNIDRATLPIPVASGREPSGPAPVNTVVSSVSSFRTAVMIRTLVESSTVSSPVTTLLNSVLLSSPLSTFSTCEGPPACHSQKHTQPILPCSGKQMRSSISGPQQVHIDPDITELRCYPRKLQVTPNSVGSAVPIPAASGRESSATAPVNAVVSSVSSSFRTSVTSRTPSLSPTVSSPVTTSLNSVPLSTPLSTFSTCVGPAARHPQERAQPTLPSRPSPGNRKHPSNISPCTDPDDTELQCLSKKRRVVAGSDVSAVFVTPAVTESSATASANGVATLVSSTSRTPLTNTIKPMLSKVSSSAQTLTRRKLFSSPSRTAIRCTNGILLLSPKQTISANAIQISPKLGNIGTCISPKLLASFLCKQSSSSSALANVLLPSTSANAVLSSPAFSSIPAGEVLASPSTSAASGIERKQQQQQPRLKIVCKKLCVETGSMVQTPVQEKSSLSTLANGVQPSSPLSTSTSANGLLSLPSMSTSTNGVQSSPLTSAWADGALLSPMTSTSVSVLSSPLASTSANGVLSSLSKSASVTGVLSSPSTTVSESGVLLSPSTSTNRVQSSPLTSTLADGALLSPRTSTSASVLSSTLASTSANGVLSSLSKSASVTGLLLSPSTTVSASGVLLSPSTSTNGVQSSPLTSTLADGALLSPTTSTSGSVLSSTLASTSANGVLSLLSKSVLASGVLSSPSTSVSESGVLLSPSTSTSTTGVQSSLSTSTLADGVLLSPTLASANGTLSSASTSTLADGVLSLPLVSTSSNGVLSSPSTSTSADEVLSSLSTSTLADRLLSSLPSSASVGSGVEQKQQQHLPELKIGRKKVCAKAGSVVHSLRIVLPGPEKWSSSLVEMGVVPSGAGVSSSAVSVATENSSRKERTASSDSRIDNRAKDSATKSKTKKEKGMTRKTRPGHASGASVTPMASRALYNEVFCVKCYEHFVGFQKSLKNSSALKGKADEGSPSLERNEISGEVRCSMCSTDDLAQMIVKHIVIFWSFECKYCKRRFNNKSKLIHHEKGCLEGMKGIAPGCVLCAGNYCALNSHSSPVLFNMGLRCLSCKQFFRCLFNLRVYWKKQRKCIHLHFLGFSCNHCDLFLKNKMSLNAHMKKHGKLAS